MLYSRDTENKWRGKKNYRIKYCVFYHSISMALQDISYTL